MKYKSYYFILLFLMFMKLSLAQSPQIVQMEYFFDADPGFGQAIQVIFTNDTIINVSFNADISKISPGHHKIFARIKDALGKWSLMLTQDIYKQDPASLPQPLPQIVAMEYFFDEDPGYGLGINVPVTQDSIIDKNFNADISLINPGYHQLFVRVKDENGKWSLVNTQDIYKQDPALLPQPSPGIVQMEYYFDDDPGYGLGVNVPVTQDSIIDKNFNADISLINPGYHQLFVRVKDENGKWSFVNKQDIYKQDPASLPQPLPNIVQMEYYFDDDPGCGLGVNVPVTEDSIIDKNFIADISLISPGYHQLFIRVKDDSGKWSLVNKQDIYKQDPATLPQSFPSIVQAEYYFDDDPGFGNGFQVEVAPDSVVNLDLAPELNFLGLGNHKMFTRVKDEFGRWSLVYTHSFTISLGADFKADNTSVPEGEEIHFTDLSTGSPTTWLWNFGDGTTSTLQNPAHIYLTAGVYDVSLTVTSNGNSHSITKNDYIQVVAPEPEIAFSPSSLNFGNVLVNEMASLWLTVSNTGNATVVINEITYGNPFFAVFSGTIAPGASQNIEVSFSPQAAVFFDDVLVFHTNIGEIEFPVSGTGEPPQSCWQFSISNWDFGWTDIETGATKNLMITNCGTQTLFVSTNLSGDNVFGISPSFFTLNGGESQTVEISFNPEEIAFYSGVLHFSSVAGEKDIILDGRGFYPSNPPQLTFSEIVPFNGISGVSPEIGPSGTYFEYQVVYTDPDNNPPMNNYPKVGIDLNGDGDFLDPGESLASLSAVNPADNNFVDGKTYSFITTLPKNKILGYQFLAYDALGNLAVGEALAYKTGPVVSNDLLDLAIYANNITFSNSTPEVGDEIVINATILNTSDYLAQNVPVAVYIENQLVYQTTMANVSPQSSASISFNYIFAYADYYPVKVVIDENNIIIEDNELNNFAIRPVLVGEVTLPGIIALTSYLSGTQAYPYGTLRFYGHASYENKKFRSSNVSGAQVVMTIHETGSTFTGYTNANGDFNIWFTVPGNPGNYSVSAEVTDFTLTATTETHFFNVVPVIIENKPDLVIYNWDINWSGDPVVNTSNVVTATFYNSGNLAAQDVIVFGYVDGVKVFEDGFENIPVGGSQTLSFETAFTNTGNHTVSLVLDPLQTIDESVESNNSASKTRYIYPAQPDLTPLEITFSDNSPLTGQLFSITAKVKNLNWVASSATSVAFYENDTNLLGILPLAGIAGGQTKTVTLSGQSLETSGWHDIKAVVDDDNLVNETNELNQEIIGNIYIEQAMADLALSTISASSYDPQTGDLLTFSVLVSNNGSALAENFWLKFSVDSEMLGDSVLITSLGIGESQTFDSETWAMQDRSFSVCAIVDESNQVVELNEYNNQRCRTFGTDLEPSINPYYAGNSSGNRLNILVGEPASLLARILNNGSFRANEVVISYLNNDETLYTDTISFINGGSFAESSGWVQFNELGDFTVQIIADNDNNLFETNEANNSVNLYVHVYENMPDLYISPAMISVSNINPEQNEWVDISASWTNSGNEPSGDFTVQLYIDQALLAESVAGNLEPGEQGSISWPEVFSTNQIGNHVIKVVLDSGNEVVEISESNNQATKNFIVGAAPDFAITAFSISNNDPDLGEMMEITATVGNFGGAEASANLNFYYQTLSGTFLIGSEAINLSKNGNTEVTAQWFVQVEAGYMKAEISGSNPPEANLANNSAQLFFGGEMQVLQPIADVVVDEDTPPFEVADLMQVFGNVDQSAMSFAVSCDEPNIGLQITAANKLKMSVAANWNGTGTAIVTAQNLYGQMAKDTFEITVTPMPDYPDLTPVELTFSENSPYAGYPFNITVKVKNLNWEISTATTVSFYEGVANLLGTATLPAIAGGQTTTITLSGTTVEPSGWHTLKAVVDPENSVEETNETNQELTKNIFIKQPLPDLTVFGIMASNTQPQPGDPVNFTATVLNSGIAAAGSFWVRFRIDGSLLGDSILVNGLDIGESQQVTSAVWNMENSPKNICVTVDQSNQIPELNELNNHNCRLFGVDLQPSKLPYYSGNSPINRLNILKGETVQLFAKVLNNGTFRVNEAEVSFVINGEVLEKDVIPFINGGSYAEASVLHAFNQTGDFIIQIITDYENEVAETDETNNAVNLFVTVYNDLPDLFIASEHIAPGSINPGLGEFIDINATYFNLGNVPSGDFLVTLYIDDEFVVDTIVGSVEPGEEASVGWPDIYQGQVPGVHIIKVVLDENNLLAEVNELNNVATREIIVGDAPDFVLAGISFSTDDPALGELMEIFVSVENDGQSAAEAMLTVYYLTMNDTILIQEVPISLLKHQTDEIVVPWFAQVEAGYIYAEITGSNPLEANLSNNAGVQYFGGEILVINPIADVEVDEDTPPFEVADLTQVFKNVDQTAMTFSFQWDEPNLNLEISPDNKLILSSELNWFGSATAVATAHNIYGLMTSDTFEIVVLPVNDVPVANAGSDRRVQEKLPVQLDGSASFDIENSTLTYLWNATVEIIFNDPTIPNPTFVAPDVEVETEFLIMLVVNDGELSSPPDTIIITVYPILEQKYGLSAGYQMISSNLIPVDPNFKTVMTDVLGSLNYARNTAALQLIKIGTVWVNQIGNWQTKEGYLVKMNVGDSLTITGEAIDAQTPINLFQGYQMMSYLPQTPINAKTALSEILDNLQLVRNSAGAQLIKIGSVWVNGIGNLNPGEGYLVKMNNPDVLIYPEQVKSILAPEAAKPVHFKITDGNPTEPVWTIFVDPSGYETGDEIGIFDGNTLVGAGVIQSGNILENFIPVFSNLCRPGNSPIIKVWKNTENREYEVSEFVFETPYDDAWSGKTFPEEDGRYSLMYGSITGLAGDDESNGSYLRIFPNPTHCFVNITGINEGTELTITVLNQAGQQVVTQTMTSNYQIDLVEFPAGMYFVKLETSQAVKYEKVVLE